MEIDWFTVIAQILNFLLLVFLLKKFLYKPVLNAIDEREKRIAAQLDDATAKETEATKERALFQQKNDELDAQRTDALNKLHAALDAERKKQTDAIRADGEALRKRMQQSLIEEQQKLSSDIQIKIQQEVIAIAQQALNDLGSASLNEQIVAVFIKRLQQLNDEEQKKFSDAFASSDHTIVVTAAFDLNDAQKQALERTIKPAAPNALFQYKQDSSFISGIQLSVKDYAISWTIENYLSNLQKHIDSPVNKQ